MKPRIIFLTGVILMAALAVSYAQLQQQPQVQSQVGPIYPTAQSPYSFHTIQSNPGPFQFNWYSGRWDYVPIPYSPSYSYSSRSQSPSPYQFNPATGRWDYVPVNPGSPSNSGSPGVGAKPVLPPTVPPPTAAAPNPPNPDDTNLWMPPATQPAVLTPPATQPALVVLPKTVTFRGRLVGIKAVMLMGDPAPHLLLHLRSAYGARGTIDIGDHMDIPPADFAPGADTQVTAVGKLGDINGIMVLFADRITFGSQTVTIDRNHGM